MNCRLCDSTELELVVKAEMPLVDGFTKSPNSYEVKPCDVYFCHSCEHAQLVDVIPPEEIFSDYLFRTGDNLNLVKHYQDYAKWLGKFDTSFVIEIGCNDGTLLKMLKGKKLGIDPSNVPCETEKIKSFLNQDLAKQVTKECGHSPLIIANHVFAHCDLNEMLDSIRLMMTSRGVFIFEVAYAQDMLDKCLYDQIEHEHLSYHSIKSLIPFLNKHGLELVEVLRNDCKGGSIRCVTKPLESWHVPYYEEDCSVERYKEFAFEIKKKREALKDIKSFVGYGAAAPCTSVMYQLNLQDRIKFLVDDNPRRWGLFSPHKNIPVVNSEAIKYTDTPKVILAPRYSDQIQARYPDIKFIVP